MIRINKRSIYNFFAYDIPIFLLGFNYVLYNAVGMDSYKNAIRIIAILLMIVGWVFRREYYITKTQLVFVLMLVVGMVINGLSFLNMLAVICFVICVKDDVPSTIRRLFIINCLLVGTMIVLGLLGIVQNVDYVSTMGRARSTLGFKNPNVGALFYSSLIYLFLLSRSKIKLKDFFIALVVTIVLFLFTDSRSPLIAMLIFIVLLYIKNKLDGKLFRRSLVIMVDTLFVASLLCVFIMNNLVSYDSIMSGRVVLYDRMIQEAGLHGLLWGGAKGEVDSFYYMLLFKYGIFMYLLLMVLTHKTMVRLMNNSMVNEMIFLLSIFCYGITESMLIRPEVLIALLVWKIILGGDIRTNESVRIKN